MATTTLYVHVDLRDTIGALEIGSLVAIFIFGIVTLQMYTYYTTFWKDLWYYKALVSDCYIFLGAFDSGVYIGCFSVVCIFHHVEVLELIVNSRLLEIGHTLGVSYEMYRDTIVLYGQPQLLTTFRALGSVIAIGGVITLLVQVCRNLSSALIVL